MEGSGEGKDRRKGAWGLPQHHCMLVEGGDYLAAKRALPRTKSFRHRARNAYRFLSAQMRPRKGETNGRRRSYPTQSLHARGKGGEDAKGVL